MARWNLVVCREGRRLACAVTKTLSTGVQVYCGNQETKPYYSLVGLASEDQLHLGDSFHVASKPARTVPGSDAWWLNLEVPGGTYLFHSTRAWPRN